MATIAELMVEINANNAELKKGLTDSKNNVRKFAKEARADLNKFAKVAAASMVAAFAGVSVAVAKVSAEIDTLAKTSSKLGIAVGELQKLRFQAQVTGISAQTLDTALQRMVRRIAEAAQGTGEAVKALQELGLNAQNLARLAPEQQFQEIARAMQFVSTSGDKVKLAMRLFDTEGVGLVNTFNSNLQATGEEFDKLNIKLTTQQAKAVEAFNDSGTKLKAIWDGFAMQVTANIAPAMKAVLDSVSDTITETGGLRVAATETAISVVQGVIHMTNAFRGLLKIIDAIKLGIGTIKALGAGMGEVVGRIQVAVEKASKNGVPSIGGIVQEYMKGAPLEAAQGRVQALDSSARNLTDLNSTPQALLNVQSKLQASLAQVRATAAAERNTAAGVAPALGTTGTFNGRVIEGSMLRGQPLMSGSGKGAGHAGLLSMPSSVSGNLLGKQNTSNINVTVNGNVAPLVDVVVSSDQFQTATANAAATATQNATREVVN